MQTTSGFKPSILHNLGIGFLSSESLKIRRELTANMSELSAELVARILHFVPLSEAKLNMQLVNKRFHEAMTMPEAHAATAKAEFPLEASWPTGVSRDVLKVMPFVSLGARQKDFSWVGFLNNLQILACDYEALRPIAPIESVRELILECTIDDNEGYWDQQVLRQGTQVFISALFPGLKKLHVNGIPGEFSSDHNRRLFFEDIQLLKLDSLITEQYPYAKVPVLDESITTLWERWDLSINVTAYDRHNIDGPLNGYLDENISALSASLLTTFTVKIPDRAESMMDLNIFRACSRLERLNFVLENPDNTVLVVNAGQLPAKCVLVHCANFVPFIQGVDAWRWEDSQSGICRNVCRNCKTIC